MLKYGSSYTINFQIQSPKRMLMSTNFRNIKEHLLVKEGNNGFILNSKYLQELNQEVDYDLFSYPIPKGNW